MRKMQYNTKFWKFYVVGITRCSCDDFFELMGESMLAYHDRLYTWRNNWPRTFILAQQRDKITLFDMTYLLAPIQVWLK